MTNSALFTMCHTADVPGSKASVHTKGAASLKVAARYVRLTTHCTPVFTTKHVRAGKRADVGVAVCPRARTHPSTQSFISTLIRHNERN